MLYVMPGLQCRMSWSYLLLLLSEFRKEVIVRFVDIGGIVDHHCLEVIVHFVDISGIVDHHCLNFLFISLYCTRFSVIVIVHH